MKKKLICTIGSLLVLLVMVNSSTGVQAVNSEYEIHNIEKIDLFESITLFPIFSSLILLLVEILGIIEAAYFAIVILPIITLSLLLLLPILPIILIISLPLYALYSFGCRINDRTPKSFLEWIGMGQNNEFTELIDKLFKPMEYIEGIIQWLLELYNMLNPVGGR